MTSDAVKLTCENTFTAKGNDATVTLTLSSGPSTHQ